MAYFDKYGAEYSDDKKALIRVPVTHQGVYEILPDTEYASFEAFQDCISIKTIIIPATLEEGLDDNCEFGLVETCKQLSYIYVEPNNKVYISKDGVLYEKKQYSSEERMIAYPPAKDGIYQLPNNVIFTESKDVCYALWCTPSILSKLEISHDNPYYTLIDDVLYDKKVETLLKVPINLKGTYRMPDSVSVIASNAFRGCSKIKSIIFGESLGYYSPDMADMSLHEQLEDCHNLTELAVHPYNHHFTCEKGFILSFDYTKTILEYYLPPKETKTARIPNIDCIWTSDVFARCNDVQQFSAGIIRGHLAKNLFANTAFYKNENNWKNGILYIDDILVKVDENYNNEELIIPPNSRVITDDSINCDAIKKIIISEGVYDINSDAIKCKNLKVIKFPHTIDPWYLDDYNYEKLDRFNVEKILIPKGYRDFFLMYLMHTDIIFEYDEKGEEKPIIPLSNEERDFYCHHKGFPCFKQYSAIKHKLLKGKGLSVVQIHQIVFTASSLEEQKWFSDFSRMDLRYMMAAIEECFKKDGLEIKSLKYLDEQKNTDKIYYLEKNH